MCVRCAEIFCAEHAPPPRRRCATCEADWKARLEGLATHRRSLLSIPLITVTAIGAGFSLLAGAYAALLGIVAIGVVTSAAIAIGTHRDRKNANALELRPEVAALREKFLDEKSRLARTLGDAAPD